ncbi:hypothetical protein [Streptomyces sp. NPDC059063]|uniref:hypothetical protein n=1 Tax=unclassified Streptomyces TaxID=2593676 RepID=UPI003689D6A4
MNLRLRLLLGVPSAVLAVVVLCACGASTDGLGPGEPAPPVSVQPSPEPLWRAWSGASPSDPGAETATRQPPPEPLKGIELGTGGLAKADVRELLRADPRLRSFADRPMIERPGRPGIRPPMLTDLSGDGKPELVVGIDLESGRSALVVYVARHDKVYPVLVTAGRRISVDVIGTDLLVRSPCPDGGEQAVRYHWDGTRMSTVSDNKTYPKHTGGPAPEPSGTPSGSSDASDSGARP